jgi:hypothetical protein
VPQLQPADESFFDTAPTRLSHRWSIARPASEVWAELVGNQAMHWCRGLSVNWTSPRPFGVGTTRQATVLGVLKVQEHYFAWEEGRRKAFYASEVNIPLFSGIAEDYLVEPDGADRCTFTWKVAVEPSALGKPGAPVNGLLFNSFFKDTGRHFDAS